LSDISKEKKDAKRAQKREYDKAYREVNKDKKREHNIAYREANKDKIREHSKAYREANKDKIREHSKAYREVNKDKKREYSKAYCEANKDKRGAYSRHRRHIDIHYRISCVLRGRIRSAIKGNYKSGSAVKDLGCSIVELRQRLEKQFKPGMTWENHRNTWLACRSHYPSCFV